jgi:hypothetical protein
MQQRMLVMRYNPCQKMPQDEVFQLVQEDRLCRNHNKGQLNKISFFVLIDAKYSILSLIRLE